MDSPSSMRRIMDEEIDTETEEFEDIVEKVQPTQCKIGFIKESVLSWVNSQRFGPSKPAHIVLTIKDDLVCILGIPYYSPGLDFNESFNQTPAYSHHYKHKLNIYFPKELDVGFKGELSFKTFAECISFLQSNGLGMKEKLPVLIHCHGGGWIRGNRALDFYGAPYMRASYAKKGFISVTVFYRLASKEHRHPTQVEDLSRSIRWIHDNAHFFGGDKSKLFLSGHSAGAHLVSLVTLQPKYLNGVGLLLDSIKGVIALSGIYHLQKTFGGIWKDSLFQKIYVIPSFGTDVDVWLEASPLLYVKDDTSLPPFILFNAFSDMGLEYGGFEFFQKLQNNGIKASHHIVPYTTHKSVSQNVNTVDLAVEFVLKRIEELAQTQTQH